MNPFQCPNCNAALCRGEVQSGRCDGCGTAVTRGNDAWSLAPEARRQEKLSRALMSGSIGLLLLAFVVLVQFIAYRLRVPASLIITAIMMPIFVIAVLSRRR